MKQHSKMLASSAALCLLLSPLGAHGTSTDVVAIEGQQAGTLAMVTGLRSIVHKKSGFVVRLLEADGFRLGGGGSDCAISSRHERAHSRLTGTRLAPTPGSGPRAQAYRRRPVVLTLASKSMAPDDADSEQSAPEARLSRLPIFAF